MAARAASNPELWVLEYLLEDDAVDEELIRRFMSKLPSVADLPAVLQMRLMLRVLRTEAGDFNDSTLSALSCCANYARGDRHAFPPGTSLADLDPGEELFVTIRTELVLRKLRESAQLDPAAYQEAVDTYFPAPALPAAPPDTSLLAKRRGVLLGGVADAEQRTGLLARHSLATVKAAMAAYFQRAQDALQPTALQLIDEDIRSGRYKPAPRVSNNAAVAAQNKRPASPVQAGRRKRQRAAATSQEEDQAAEALMDELATRAAHLSALGGPDPMPDALAVANGAARDQPASYFQAVQEAAAEQTPPGRASPPPRGSRGGHSAPREAGGRAMSWGSPAEDEAAIAPAKRGGGSGEKQRRKIGRWSEEETNTLIRLVKEMGKGKWKQMLVAASEVFANRSQVDLKDKWRNLVKQGVVAAEDPAAAAAAAQAPAAAGEGEGQGEGGVEAPPQGQGAGLPGDQLEQAAAETLLTAPVQEPAPAAEAQPAE